MDTGRGKLDDTLAAMFSHTNYKDSYLFYAHIIGLCSVKIDQELPAPAGVCFISDHYNLIINPLLFDEYTLVQRLAILKHEMLHILFKHLGDRSKNLQMFKFNVASDCAINQLIDPQHLPPDVIVPKTLEKMIETPVKSNESAEFYYNLLKDKNNEEKCKGQGKPMDTHEHWADSTGDLELQEDITKKIIEQAQIETIKSCGTIPNQCSQWIELNSRSNEVNWKKVLRGIIGHKKVSKRSTIMRSDRRFPEREDLRGKIKNRIYNLLVIIDVSGSMNNDAINTVLSEVRYICDITKTDVDLIQVDTHPCEPEKLSKKTKAFTRKASGGTNLFPAIQKAKDCKIDFQAIIVLTDGELFSDEVQKFKSLNKKIIWLIEPNGKLTPDMQTGRMQGFKLKEPAK